MSWEGLAAEVAAGGRRAIGEALNLLDDRRPEPREQGLRLLEALPQERLESGGRLIGLTGPPGAGKSTLAAGLIRHWREAGLRVGVLAVDPSSVRTGGALLGDRLRMLQPRRDEGLFIRSLASRGQLGGLSEGLWPMSQVMLSAFDVVLIETVGVGQNEQDVAWATDTVCFVVQPASGDTIQFMKSGVLEAPHVLAVNKSDLGPPARVALRELERALAGREQLAGWPVRTHLVSARDGLGLAELAGSLEEHHRFLQERGELEVRRRSQRVSWVLRQLREEFGRHGLSVLGGERNLINNWPACTTGEKTLRETLRHYRSLRDRLLRKFKDEGDRDGESRDL